jgi:hypothetical protein
LNARSAPAPTFAVRDGVSHVYDKWSRHYNECAECRRDDWYNPLMGEALLCALGRALFGMWVRMTRITVPPLGQRARYRGSEAARG